MYFSLIITFLLILMIVLPIIQNSMPLDLKFFTWQLQMSLAALIFYSSLFGGAIIALLALPRLIDKHFHAKKLNKGVYELKKKIVELEKEHGR